MLAPTFYSTLPPVPDTTEHMVHVHSPGFLPNTHHRVLSMCDLKQYMYIYCNIVYNIIYDNNMPYNDIIGIISRACEGYYSIISRACEGYNCSNIPSLRGILLYNVFIRYVIIVL